MSTSFCLRVAFLLTLHATCLRVSGMKLDELMPELSRCGDLLAFVRTVNH